jgi:hypothetical protein
MPPNRQGICNEVQLARLVSHTQAKMQASDRDGDRKINLRDQTPAPRQTPRQFEILDIPNRPSTQDCVSMPRQSANRSVFLQRNMFMSGKTGKIICLTAKPGAASTQINFLKTDHIIVRNRPRNIVQDRNLGASVHNLSMRTKQIIAIAARAYTSLNVPSEQF